MLRLQVTGSRFTDAYNQRRLGSSYHRSSYYSPPVPPRPETKREITPPASPPRKVLSSFKTFSAPSMSMSGVTSPGSPEKAEKTPPHSPFSSSMSAFGLRSPPSVKKQEEDVDADAVLNGVELRMGGISLEQANKIARSVAFRAAR